MLQAVHVVFHRALSSVFALYLLVEAVNEADGIVPHVVIFGLCPSDVADVHPLFVFRCVEDVVTLEAYTQFLVEEVLFEREIQHLHGFSKRDSPVVSCTHKHVIGRERDVFRETEVVARHNRVLRLVVFESTSKKGLATPK